MLSILTSRGEAYKRLSRMDPLAIGSSARKPHTI